MPRVQNSPAKDVDHFKIWKVKEIAFHHRVDLKGQFDDKAWKANIDSVQYIANPVQKNNEPIHNENVHLVAYFLTQPKNPGPRRWVTLTNQISPKGTRWRLTDPALLLVPAGKTFPPKDPSKPKRSVDHYLCYLVSKPTAVKKAVKLVDQFDKKREKVEEIADLEPAFFCVPVEKNDEAIINKNVHLAIYDITPTVQLKPLITVNTADQLRSSKLEVTESLMLAVPSRKTGWGRTPIRTTTTRDD